MSNIKSKVRVKFTVGNDKFIVKFENENAYYQWIQNFTYGEMGKYGHFMCDENRIDRWIPYSSPLKCEVLE